MITSIPTSLSSSSPFSIVEEQQNNQKRKREEEEEEEEEMGCEPPQQITNIPHSPSPHFQFHPTTPEKSTPYPPNPNIVKRMQESICYKCGQQGHWAKYCPLKTPNKNNNHSPVLSSDKQIWCGCGHGVCLLKTAHTPNNYGREFFTCPIRLGKPCGTFKWCDGTIHESDFQRPLFKYPVCQCGAGVCGKVMEGGKSYFICPIKQGHGSCGYHVSEDELLNNASIDEPVDDTSIVPYRQSKHRSLNEHIEGDQVDTAGNDLTNDFAEGSVLLSTTKRMRITDGSENPSPVAVSEIPKGKSRGSPIEEVNSQPDGFPDIEFEGDLESIASLMANEAEASLTSRFSTPLKISCRQNVFQGDIISADASFGMFPSFDPMDVPEQASTLHSQSECNDLVIKSPNQCTQLSADVISPNRSPGSEKLKERKQREAVIFMQQGLLNDLEGFDFHQHESMRDTAEAAFSVLNCLGFGYKQFSDYVWEFINHAKSMTEIDKSMENSPTLEEHSKFLEEEKVRLANIRDDCVKIETLLAVSDEIRNLLSEEVAIPPPSPEKSEKDDGKPVLSSPSPVKEIKSETKQVLPVLELKEGTRSSWKFSREAPRLSLDSRAVVDAKGGLHPREIRTNATANLENDGDKQRRSTSSVIVRLMGLDSLPSDSGAKLQRSASESRVSRDRFSEPKLKSNGYTQRSNVGSGQMNNNNHHRSNAVNVNNNVNVVNSYGNIDNGLWNGRGVEGGRGKQNKGTMMVQKKSFYDSTDFFPEPKHNDLIYGEIEKRLKMRGINQPSQDLDTLKHILEALQLKGLLHSQKHDQSPIVLMKPLRSSSPSRFERFNRTGYDSPPPHSSVRSSPRARRNLSPRFDDRAQVNSRNSSPTRRNVPNVETRRRLSNEGVDSRRVSPVNSPKISSRRNATAQTATGGSPRMRKVIDPKVKMLGVAEDEWSTVSENSFTTSNSLTDTEKYKLEEYKEGRNLLDRCDKLLNSIAEITAANELQPSPVSVLDSSFYKDEWCSPSPITKRCIDYNFKDQSTESEDDMWSAGEGKSEEEAKSEDCDFVYVSEILRASSYLPEECDIFLLLEKQQFRKGKDTSKAPTLQRRLIFDTLQEILNRNQRLPPWKAVSKGEETHQIWSEFRRIREREESESEDLFGVICGVLKKDMAEEMSGWGEWTVEMGDVVLDIERLIFKDLIGETIQDLASFAPQCNKQEALRRKLVF